MSRIARDKALGLDVPTTLLAIAGLYGLTPKVLDALTILKPETVVRWHRAGFRVYWRWKSRLRGGRPSVSADARQLIREMSAANPLWAAPRIHGELLKLGIEVAQSTVAKYMAKRRPGSGRRGRRSCAIMWPACGRYWRHGLPCGPGEQLSTAVRLGHPAARTATPDLAERHRPSDGGVDRSFARPVVRSNWS